MKDNGICLQHRFWGTVVEDRSEEEWPPHVLQAHHHLEPCVTMDYVSFSLEEYQASVVFNFFMAGTELLVCSLHHLQRLLLP